VCPDGSGIRKFPETYGSVEFLIFDIIVFFRERFLVLSIYNITEFPRKEEGFNIGPDKGVDTLTGWRAMKSISSSNGRAIVNGRQTAYACKDHFLHLDTS
jgi:hypothetical protein